MPQAKFTLEDDHAEFVDRFRSLGYPDKHALVRDALQRMKDELAATRLRESATLYAELYVEDEDLQELTEQACDEWPE